MAFVRCQPSRQLARPVHAAMNKQIFDSIIAEPKARCLPAALPVARPSVPFGLTRSLVLMRLRDKINLAVQNAAMAGYLPFR